MKMSLSDCKNMIRSLLCNIRYGEHGADQAGLGSERALVKFCNRTNSSWQRMRSHVMRIIPVWLAGRVPPKELYHSTCNENAVTILPAYLRACHRYLTTFSVLHEHGYCHFCCKLSTFLHRFIICIVERRLDVWSNVHKSEVCYYQLWQTKKRMKQLGDSTRTAVNSMRQRQRA